MKSNHYSAVMSGPGSFRVERKTTPRPGPKDIKVRLEGCGVCGSNLPVWQGRPWFKYPMEAGSPGHEGWGTVEEIGSEVERTLVGDRVALLSYHAFGEVEVVHEHQCVVLPVALKDMDFPGEALGCAMNILKRADIHRGQFVAVIGAGFLGTLLVQLAAIAGATVIAISRRPASLEIARVHGASHVIKMDQHREIVSLVNQLTSGELCDRVIEATGLQRPLDLAAELCAYRGRLIIAGYHQDGLREVNMQLWNWRGLEVINAHERDPEVYLSGMREAVNAIVEGRMNPEPLYSHRFPLSRIGKAFELLDSREGSFIKALITYD